MATPSQTLTTPCESSASPLGGSSGTSASGTATTGAASSRTSPRPKVPKARFLVDSARGAELAAAEIARLPVWPPFEVRVGPVKQARAEFRNRQLNAHLRDIARHRCGSFAVPERVFERVVEDFKRTDIWPRDSDSEPDYFTGEVLYRPKSRGDLSEDEAKGIVRWLEHYMAENNIPSNAPAERWSDEG